MGVAVRPARRRSPLLPLSLMLLLLPPLQLTMLMPGVVLSAQPAARDPGGQARTLEESSVEARDVVGDRIAGESDRSNRLARDRRQQQQQQHHQQLQHQHHQQHHQQLQHQLQQGHSSATQADDAAPPSDTPALRSHLQELRADVSALSKSLRHGSARLAQRLGSLEEAAAAAAGEAAGRLRDSEAAREALAALDTRVSAVTGLLLQLVAACDWSCGDSGQMIRLEEAGAPHERLFPENCADIYKQRIRESGIYTIQPASAPEPFEAFCDMETDGGGWTVFQRRRDGSQDFNRTWDEYKRGFGEPGGEHWLGNDRLHQLTLPSSPASSPPSSSSSSSSLSSSPSSSQSSLSSSSSSSSSPPPSSPPRWFTLRVELEDWAGVRRHAVYAHFRVAPERERYRLTARGYRGDAGNALSYSRGYNHDGRPFSTPDRDHDAYAAGSCAAYYAAGWWFDSCLAANLNGRYHRGGAYRGGVTDGIYWGTWYILSDYRTGRKYSFRSVEMKARPAGF